jgi:hypothetical protein
MSILCKFSLITALMYVYHMYLCISILLLILIVNLCNVPLHWYAYLTAILRSLH